MKRTILFAVMMMAVCSVNAQFEINSDGIIKIGTNTTSSASMNIKAARTNILSMRNGTANGIAPTLEGQCYVSSSQWAMGIRGAAYGTNGAINCGLWGIAGNGGSYKDYGVFGCIENTGAAIYGQASPWAYSSGTALTSAYAGYFAGRVHVQGDFSYSGTLLTASPNPSEIQTESLSWISRGTNATSNRLQSIDVQSYYHTAPYQRERPTMTDQDFAGMDSMEVEAIKKSLAEGEVNDIIADQVYAKQHYTLNADQLEEVFPDLVYENEDGTKSINYVEMVPILVQAINELSAKVEVLEGKNAANKVATRSTTNVDEKGENLVMLSLGQNKPNPFGTTTSIEVSIPDDVQNAFIYVYDLQGKKVDQVDITARGKQTVQLSAVTLSDGMYLYSLIADGKVVETRRMIVEK